MNERPCMYVKELKIFFFIIYLALVRMRYIESDDNQCMRGAKLEEAILADKAKGLVPFWVCKNKSIIIFIA